MQELTSPETSPPSVPPPPESLRLYLGRVAVAVFFLLLLPIMVLSLLERGLDAQVDASDRSLILFILFLFFVTYLFILGFRTPIHVVQQWRTRIGRRLQPQEEETDPRTEDPVPGSSPSSVASRKAGGAKHYGS